MAWRQGTDKMTQAQESTRAAPSPSLPPRAIPRICESTQLPTDALCKQGHSRASLAFKVLLIQHEKAICL